MKRNKLKFYDGDFFNYPLQFTTFVSGRKLYFKWLAEDDNEVVIYQKPN